MSSQVEMNKEEQDGNVSPNEEVNSKKESETTIEVHDEEAGAESFAAQTTLFNLVTVEYLLRFVSFTHK